jgi:uncharacterized protein YdeI (YjbR/CyaY-like superfamily)
LEEEWIGFHKKTSGRPSISWPESVDEALCFGWIDGLRKTIDETSYKIRFTPRRPTSIWSTVNTRRMAALTAEGRVRPPGLAAFARRSADRTGVYSYEHETRPEALEFDAATERRFRRHARAWKYFAAQSPWYRRTLARYVMSAKREETRARRLGVLIDSSAKEQPIPGLYRPLKTTKKTNPKKK